MPDTPSPNPGRPIGEFKARLNRDIAFTIIDEQVRSGIDQAQITGRGLAKQYGFGSPQTWVTHLKDWRQQHGHAPTVEEGVREAETVEGEPPAEPREDGAAYGMISRSDFLQQQEMWNRLLAEREAAHAERLKVARLEGENAGRVTGREEGVALAEARERMLDERVRRERLEGERAGELRAQQDLALRLRGERRLLVALAFLVGALAGGAALWWRLTPAAAVVPPALPPSTVPEATPLPVPQPPESKPIEEKPGDVKPVDVKPADIKPPEATPPEEPKPIDAPPPGEPVPAPP